MAGDITSGAGSGRVSRKTLCLNLSGSGMKTLPARPYCSMESRVSATHCSFAAMRRWLPGWGAKVMLSVPDPLSTCCAMWTASHKSCAMGDPLPRVDYQCPLMSLPLAFNTRLTTIPHLPTTSRAIQSSLRIGVPGSASEPGRASVSRGAAIRSARSIKPAVLPWRNWIGYLPGGFQYVCLQKEAARRGSRCTSVPSRTAESRPGTR